MSHSAVGSEPAAEPEPANADRAARAATLVFLGAGVAASAFYLVVGRRTWFRNDEWDFLSHRTVGDLGSLFRSHFGHWSTLPILVYRLMWWIVGLRTYVPYLLLIIALHFFVAWLLRCVMRRSGVGAWIATVAALVYVLFGRGYQDIVWAFQITQVGSLAFGLTHLLLADHDGPVDRRDWLGLAAGFAGLLCSGVSVAMVIVVGIAVLVRRGWRVALLHTAPLAAAYLVWFLTAARNAYQTSGSSLFAKGKFVVATVLNTLRGISAVRGGQWLLLVLLLAGLGVAWLGLSRPQFVRRAAAPFASLVGAGVFLAITSVGRAGLPGATYRSRYTDLTLALLLPAVAVAADGLVRRWRVLAIPVVVVLLLGVPGNLRAINTFTAHQQNDTRRYRHTVLALPYSPVARSVPPGLEPIPGIAIGWLLGGAASGRVPKPKTITRSEARMDALRLSLRSRKSRVVKRGSCRVVDAPVDVRLRAHTALMVTRGSIHVVPVTGATDDVYPLAFDRGTVLTPSVARVRFRVERATPSQSTQVCAPKQVFAAA